MAEPPRLVGAIRNLEKYVEAAQRRRTERFNYCFPRGISFGDIDSFVEVAGRFLFIEWKVGDQKLTTGQEIALARLASQPNITVWVVWTDEEGLITHGRDMARPGVNRFPTTQDRVGEKIKGWVSGTRKAA